MRERTGPKARSPGSVVSGTVVSRYGDPVRAVCVIGLGLIGGSVLRAASAARRQVWGATASSEDAAAATADGYRVESQESALRMAAEQDALVVLAVPLPAIEDVLRTVATQAPECLLTDVVSVKAPVAEAVARLVPGARYVGGHPMSGSSSSGWRAADAELFRSRAWALCVTEDEPADGDTALEPWLATVRLALDCGAHVVPVEATAHDSAVARVSHLPHVLAAVLAAVGADGGEQALALAAGSFGDGTRVAGSDPELVRAMCEGNAAALLPVLDDALGKLGAARGALASTGSLGATLRAGHAGRAALTERSTSGAPHVRIDLAAPQAATALLGVGAKGGRLLALDGTTVIAEVA